MSRESISFPRELSDEMAELIADKARVCGGGAFEIWEAICEQFGTTAPVARCTCPSGDGSLRWPCPVCPPEPVAYLCEATHESGRPAKWLQYGRKISNLWRADEVSFAPLYRHPPSQAPVVLPARKIAADYWCAYEQPFPGEAAGIWNACLDEFKRLNPGITEAAPLRKS